MSEGIINFKPGVTPAGGSPGGKTVLLRAPLLTQSGYGVHSRQVFRWLRSRPGLNLIVEPLQWGITPWYLNRDCLDGLVGQIMDCSKPLQGPADVTFQVQLPNEWDPKLGRFNIGLTAGVETDRCNPSWLENCNSMDRIVVPSEHTRSVFLETGGVKVPVDVVSESYPAAIDADKVDPIDVEFAAPFNFLLVGQFTGKTPEADRKRLMETLRWLCEAFEGDETTGIIIKTNMGRNTRIDRDVCMRSLRDALPHRKDGFPKVHVLHGAMSEREMSALYRHPSVGALVTATRGEGFGLPILEAAASGLPVVATGWSGHMDFMGLGKFIKLDYELKKIPDSRVDNAIFVAGSRWAEVDQFDFKKKVKKLRESSELPRQWALDLQAEVRKKFSPAAIEAAYDELLGGVL